MSQTIELGDLMTALYNHYLVQYRDEELAAVATAAIINELLYWEAHARTGELECAA